MNRPSRQPGSTIRRRGGFTLVELLVSVALVVLMMLMFAEIFSLAGGAVSTQKGIATNDQKVRTFTTLLRQDLDTRTFRDVMPFAPVDPSLASVFDQNQRDLLRRKGYFSISENDPLNQTDDVLSFTIDVAQIRWGRPAARLFGKAASLGGPAIQNQPDWDDGEPMNGLGSSTLAEVAYFVRNGNLYRSVMLIREPYANVPPTGDEEQPKDSGSYLIPDTTSGSGYPGFWKNFDYSAFFDSSTGQNRAFFATEAMLNNSNSSGALMGLGVPRSLGIPHLRYGHDIGDSFGKPVEFLGGFYVGRLLKQEVSHSGFTYPGQSGTMPALTPVADPYRPGDYYFTPDGNLPPTLYRGEELLIPNVHEFDVQVWDDGLVDNGVAPGQFVNLGYDPTPFGGFGYYAQASPPAANGLGYSNNPDYGNRFDTWHPALGVALGGVTPYRGIYTASGTRFGVDQMPGTAGVDDDQDGVTDFSDTIVINKQFDPGEQDPEEIGWIGTDDERPLRAIQVQVRFYDPKSAQIRQLSLVHSLIDPKQ